MTDAKNLFLAANFVTSVDQNGRVAYWLDSQGLPPFHDACVRRWTTQANFVQMQSEHHKRSLDDETQNAELDAVRSILTRDCGTNCKDDRQIHI